MVGTIGFEPTTSTVSICLSSFYGLLSCSPMLFLSIYYQCVIRLLIVSCFIIFYPVFDRNLDEQSYVPPDEVQVFDEAGYVINEYLPEGSKLYQLEELSRLHPHWPDIGEETESEIISDFCFKIEDIKHLEKQYGMTNLRGGDGLSSEDARELGRLRREKSKWDDSIKASVLIGIFCNKSLKQGEKITRDMLAQKIFDLGLNDMPNTTIDKIWKTIPERYRKKADRPTKKKT